MKTVCRDYDTASPLAKRDMSDEEVSTLEREAQNNKLVSRSPKCHGRVPVYGNCKRYWGGEGSFGPFGTLWNSANIGGVLWDNILLLAFCVCILQTPAIPALIYTQWLLLVERDTFWVTNLLAVMMFISANLLGRPVSSPPIFLEYAVYCWPCPPKHRASFSLEVCFCLVNVLVQSRCRCSYSTLSA